MRKVSWLYPVVMALVVAACGGGESDATITASTPAPTEPTAPTEPSAPTGPSAPTAPTGLKLTYAAKAFHFSWNAAAGAEWYELIEDPDGPGGQPATQVGARILDTDTAHAPTALLHERLNALYTVRACNAGGCSAPTAALQPDVVQAIGYFKASNTGSGDYGDYFGYRLALSADGSTLAAGAPAEDSNAVGVDGNQADSSSGGSGAVYVFTRAGSAWSQQAYVKASNTGAFDQFGASLALSADGSSLVVGATTEDSNATGIGGNQADGSADNAGAVYVFARAGAAWNQRAYVKASNTGAGDQFGWSVALSADGSTLAVGAPAEASSATGIGGNQADGSAIGSGAVYVY